MNRYGSAEGRGVAQDAEQPHTPFGVCGCSGGGARGATAASAAVCTCPQPAPPGCGQVRRRRTAAARAPRTLCTHCPAAHKKALPRIFDTRERFFHSVYLLADLNLPREVFSSFSASPRASSARESVSST